MLTTETRFPSPTMYNLNTIQSFMVTGMKGKMHKHVKKDKNVYTTLKSRKRDDISDAMTTGMPMIGRVEQNTTKDTFTT